MKRLLLSIVVAVIMLSGCEKKYTSPEEIIDKVRREAAVSSEEIVYAGSSAANGSELLWYTAGNDQYNLNYIPVQCYFTSEEEYIFVQTFKPIDRGDNIAVLQWMGGYSFLVNNPDCTQITIRNGYEIKDIPVTHYPFVYYNSTIPNEYDFFDAEGNVLTH